ncbi:hypothetical protein [Latilactobacillus fuchuensis]|uniref:Uncharacterized protein n=2 Tax=Latilactobacillus fuchuensis TaxID=164393 RepID=A0A2N9DWH6_9LACO|nr:hypothetical protein [Latilactobacillus fuchuensis]KRL58828.1 hypothetical protein FC69_GL000030 [Latilactobacillus fuchuensis DSM 14340 = JCM 11249]MCP8858038.1 hypothetical protein [Latilactobacillus fuchuensis]SPC39023.1 conserved hypothetical protein [Latilactobacillus fuchuensis]
MTEENWLQQQIQQLQSQATTYEDQAFYQALGQVSHELAQRIEQRQGELDGRIWNATKW